MVGCKSLPALGKARPGTAPARTGDAPATAASTGQVRPVSAVPLKKKKKPEPLTDADDPPKPGKAWAADTEDDLVLTEVCAQLDQCALEGWKASLDLKEK